jgi:hypothetical protein
MLILLILTHPRYKEDEPPWAARANMVAMLKPEYVKIVYSREEEWINFDTAATFGNCFSNIYQGMDDTAKFFEWSFGKWHPPYLVHRVPLCP